MTLNRSYLPGAGVHMAGSGRGVRARWGEVVLSSVAAVSWALMGMVGTAALGLHLLGADTTGALGPLTAAVVVLAAHGSLTPSGDVSAYGLEGAAAETAVDITPLGVSLIGALLLAHGFLRSLRRAGSTVAGREVVARVGVVVGLWVAAVGGLAWVGHDVITVDGRGLGLSGDRIPGAGDGGVDLPGLGELGDIGGLLPDRLRELADADASVGFTVDLLPSLGGALLWVLGVLAIALLANRGAPLPPSFGVLHRVRPALSALVTVVVVTVVAGHAAAGYAALGDDQPRRIAGAALLGAPNGTWLGMSLGLGVPWEGGASGELGRLLPDPLDEFLGLADDRPATVAALAELDGRMWLLAAAAGVSMLYAGVLTAVRTPRGHGLWSFTGGCALRLGTVTALALPLLVWLTDVSANASLSVLGVDAFGAGIELHGRQGAAALLGGLWGACAGGVGAVLVHATRGAPGETPVVGPTAGEAGPYRPTEPYRPPNPDTNPYLRLPPKTPGTPTVPAPLSTASPGARSPHGEKPRLPPRSAGGAEPPPDDPNGPPPPRVPGAGP